MKTKVFIFFTLLASFNMAFSKTYKDEKEITFEAKNGQSSIAYEGSFMVPENRNKKDSRMIPIKYVRFPATGKNGSVPIVYLSGGPGGSGIQTAKHRRFPLFMKMREFGDVIALDQRGTGASDINPKCNSSIVIDQSEIISDQKHIELHQKALVECLDFWKSEGVDIFGYTTNESVNDLVDLRKHLQAEKISLWGISYGSHLALAALKTIDDQLDKVIIASAEGLSQTVKLPARTDEYFDRLQAAINTQEKSKAMFPDIKALIKRVHAKLDAQPIKLEISLPDGKSYTYVLHRRILQEFSSGLISDPGSAKMMLHLYLAIDHNILEPVIEVISKYNRANSPISYRAMSVAMDLASGMSIEKRQMVQQQAKTSLLKDYLNFSYHLTDVLPSIDLGDEFRKKPESAVPTLLLTGTLDGRTYIKSQQEAVSGLTQLTSVLINSAGHNLFMKSDTEIWPEVEQAMSSFMLDQTMIKKTLAVPLPSFSEM